MLGLAGLAGWQGWLYPNLSSQPAALRALATAKTHAAAPPLSLPLLCSAPPPGDLLKKGGGRYQVSGALRPIQPSQSTGPGGGAGGGYGSQRSGAASQQVPAGSKRSFGQW